LIRFDLKKVTALLLVVFISASAQVGFAKTVEEDLNDTVQYIYKNHASWKDTSFDWILVGLFSKGEDLSAKKWSKLIKQNETIRDEMLKDKLANTDLERIILGLLAEGKSPDNYKGKNLIEMLKSTQLPNGKFADASSGEGEVLINSHIWGIIALYAAGEEIPNSEKALEWLVSQQKEDGGFSHYVKAKESDVDMTAMAIMALSALECGKDNESVNKALQYLKDNELSSGGFASWGTPNSESTAQVIQALAMLGENPDNDEWKVDGKGALDNLRSFKKKDGSFAHYKGGMANIMATQQALIALSDYQAGESVYARLRQVSLKKQEKEEEGFSLFKWLFNIK
jgi:prenyltransferase beta subunit